MVATIGGLCLILGQQDALLAVATRLWRWEKRGSKRDKLGGSADAKHAGKEGVACMLMAPGPSSWAAGATESRSPVGGDRTFGPKVDLRALVAFQEAPGPHEIN